MTSMLLTERKGLPSARGAAVGLFLRAVARRNSLLLRVGGRGFLDHWAHDRLVGLDPVGDQLPPLAVPLLELVRAPALVVRAGNLNRMQEVVGAEILDSFQFYHYLLPPPLTQSAVPQLFFTL